MNRHFGRTAALLAIGLILSVRPGATLEVREKASSALAEARRMAEEGSGGLARGYDNAAPMEASAVESRVSRGGNPPLARSHRAWEGVKKGFNEGATFAFWGVVEAPAAWLVDQGLDAPSGKETAWNKFADIAGTVLFIGLFIPATLVGLLAGAPIGAAAGAVAEFVKPGSTDSWNAGSKLERL